MLTTLIVHLANRSCVLERIAGLVRRRGIEIRSASIGPTDMPGALRMTIVVEADHNKTALLAANLHKLADVARVETLTPDVSLFRELAIVKVATTPEERSEIFQIATVFRARIVDMCPGSTAIEATGSEAKIDALIEALGIYGIVEIARTGRIAMVRGLNKKARVSDDDGRMNEDGEAEHILASKGKG
jgi:acetolactate synthase I/III small subunit